MTLPDISGKPRSLKRAVAGARLGYTQPISAEHYTLARVAAVQAAKETSRILPSRHPSTLESVAIEFSQEDGFVDIQVEVKAIQRAGVESEALLAASAAAIALHDLLGGGVELALEAVLLLDTSEIKINVPAGIRAGILVLSDSVAGGNKQDRSGTTIQERLIETGITVAKYLSIPDDSEAIEHTLLDWCEKQKLNLIITTGGTGLGPRDNTPEVLDKVLERRLPGVEEAMRSYGQERTPFAMLSRSRAGQRGQTVIVALPGSPRAVKECLDTLMPTLLHAVPIMDGGGH